MLINLLWDDFNGMKVLAKTSITLLTSRIIYQAEGSLWKKQKKKKRATPDIHIRNRGTAFLRVIKLENKVAVNFTDTIKQSNFSTSTTCLRDNNQEKGFWYNGKCILSAASARRGIQKELMG